MSSVILIRFTVLTLLYVGAGEFSTMSQNADLGFQALSADHVRSAQYYILSVS